MRAQRIRGDLNKSKNYIKRYWIKNYDENGVKKSATKIKKAVENVQTNKLERTPVVDGFEKK